MNPDKGLLDWAGPPGPRKVLAAARRRLDQGSDLTGSPLRVSLTADERKEVSKLLGVTWAHSGRAVSARALAEAIGNLGANVPELLAAIGTPVRDLRGVRIAARQGAEEERERAVTALTDADVPADGASAWVARRGLPAAGSGQLAGLASRCARVWEHLPSPNADRSLLTVLAVSMTPPARKSSRPCGLPSQAPGCGATTKGPRQHPATKNRT